MPRITELPTDTAPEAADLIAFVDTSASRTEAVTLTNLAASAPFAVASITSGTITGITDLAVADGGTGASTPGGARTSLGVGTVGTKSTITHYEVVTFPSTAVQADNASAWRCPATGTLVKADIWCDTAPVTAVVTVDLHKNSTTVFTTQSNRPSIATSATADDSGTPEVTTMSAGDLFQFQIDALNAADQADIGQLMCRITWTETIS